MRTLLLACALLLFGSAAQADGGKHPLWTVRGKTNTVYLFGSVHYLKPTEKLPAALDKAYQDAEAVVMEIDMDDLNPITTTAATMQLGMLPAGDSLEKTVGPEVFQKFAAAARTLGADAAMFAQFRPWLAAMTLDQLQLMKLGFDASSGVEQRLVARAKTDRKEITGLETVEEQLNIFAKMSPRNQREFLTYTIDEMSQMGSLLDKLLPAWRVGDVKQLESLLQGDLDDHPELYGPLTTERNRRWIGTLESLLQQPQDYLVVVGTLHLVGKDSVVDLLQKKGYKVIQQ
jgi:uncharacterized protein YbaP (TraB family)